tara:strand:+ start:11894 stop:12133 length:240 start_codon:yes stop_codon:yes gene_type:complete
MRNIITYAEQPNNYYIMKNLVTYDNQPNNFALHWDMAACYSDGQFAFWDKFLDAQAMEYLAPDLSLKYNNVFEMVKDNG